MTTAKNEVFIGLYHENCYIGGGGQKFGGGSLLGGIFPGMSKFLFHGRTPPTPPPSWNKTAT